MQNYEFDEATLAKVKEFETSLETTQADIIKYSIKKQLPVFEQRDVFLKTVDNFWFKALQNCMAIGMYIDDEDRDALKHLNTVRVERNLEDPREATVHLDFGDNEYFSNKTLTKVFKVRENADPLGSDDFEFAESVKTEKVKIDWKSDEKNLSKKSPAVQPTGDDDDDDQLDPGSFFSSFFEDDQTYSIAIGDTLINEFYPRAIEYYLGHVEEEDYSMYESGDEEEFDDEDDEEDEEDDDDDDREIDLEEEEAREAKKAKK